MSNAIIKTTGLNYFFSRGQQTLHDINLQVEKGSVYGFLGPNGAGKTTTVEILEGLTAADEGMVELLGQHCKQRHQLREQALHSQCLVGLLDLRLHVLNRKVRVDLSDDVTNAGNHG